MRFLILFICLVAVYDIYCTVKHQDHIMTFERNAIARMLIEEVHDTRATLDVGQNGLEFTSVKSIKADVSLLIAFKCLGLLAAEQILDWSYRSNTRAGRLIIYVITAFQAALLSFLIAG